MYSLLNDPISIISRACVIIAVFVLHNPFAYSASRVFPSQIRNSDYECYSELLLLSDFQYNAIYDMFTEYAISYNAMLAKESDNFKNNYPYFLTLSYNISSNQPVDSRSLREYRRISNRILYLDNSFFDNMATLLSREQLQRMNKIRNARERSRYIQLLQHAAFSNMSQIDLSTIYSALTLTQEERAAADPLIIAYEARLRQLLKNACGSALRLRSEVSRKIKKASLPITPESPDDNIRVIRGIWHGELVKFDGTMHKIGLLHWRYHQILVTQLSRDNIDIINEYYFSTAYPNIDKLGVGRVIRVLENIEANVDATDVDMMTITLMKENYKSKVYALMSELAAREIERVKTNLSAGYKIDALEYNDSKERDIIDKISEETVLVLRSLTKLDKRTELLIKGIRKNITVTLDREILEHAIVTTFTIERGGRKTISYAYIDGVLANEYQDIGKAVIRLYGNRIRLSQQELHAIYRALEIDREYWMVADLLYEDFATQIANTCGSIDIDNERAMGITTDENELLQSDGQLTMIRGVFKAISRYSMEYISNVAILSNTMGPSRDKRIEIVTEYIKSRAYLTLAKSIEKYIRFLGRNTQELKLLERNGYEMCTDILWLYEAFQTELSLIPPHLDDVCESGNMISRHAANILEQDLAMLLFQSTVINNGMRDSKSDRKYIIDAFVVGDDIQYAVESRNAAVNEIAVIIRRIITRSCDSDSIDEMLCNSIRDKYWLLEYVDLSNCEKELERQMSNVADREPRGSNQRVIAEDIMLRYRLTKAEIDQQMHELLENAQGVEVLILQRHALCEAYREEIRSKMKRMRP